MECISVFDMLKIGIGPSSSHTLGPWRAAERFIAELLEKKVFDSVTKIQVDLYGSLSLTGKGHATDLAIMLGLTGADPVTIPIENISSIVKSIQESEKLLLNHSREISFDPKLDIKFKKEFLSFHANGMTFKANLSNGKQIKEAFTPMSVTITLEDEIDISRGDMIVRENNAPEIGQEIELLVTWMSNTPIHPRTKVLIKHTTSECIAMVKELKYKVDINTLHRVEDIKNFEMNDIGRMSIRTSKPLFYDTYKRNRQTGSLIIIDEQTNETIGAGMII